MSTPWFSTESELEPKRLFSAPNLQAAAASIALPGSGHLMRGRTMAGIILVLFSLNFYGMLILLRVALELPVYIGAGVAVLLLSCAAAYHCCLHGSPHPAGRKLGLLALIFLGSAIWANAVCNLSALAAGFRYFVVPGKSMEPTFHEGDWILVDSRYYEHQKPQHGDIVVVNHSYVNENQSVYLVKRVSGVAGDTVKISGGKLIRNGFQVEENYTALDYGPAPEEWLRNMPLRTIPQGELFLLGDNRGLSYDSRAPDVGNYPEYEVVGKVVRRAWGLWKKKE